ncbi:hypothetical protein BOTCAL_0582g00060 [Botryotinia calthae]|uniref:Uncharacterized protein n=1 Tax=Botryotinia calthae TaxID=38488 RepID=A0A4Y8CJ91_9HELO|nr:hypothetical protein BOTCAL_0582g00060 [Botryotinia calthae]
MKARKEFTISAGTYGSPSIPLRSGIGAKQEVEKLQIQNQVDFQVSQRPWLMDYWPVILSFPEVSKPDLTNEHLVCHKGGKSKFSTQYKTNKIGFSLNSYVEPLHLLI